MNKQVTITVTDVKRFISFLDGSVITSVAFRDGKTARVKEFRCYRAIEAGDKVKALKIGSGKYAGYNF